MKTSKHGVFKIKDLGYLALGALVVGACSPVAPSVSKLSNAALRMADSSNAASSLTLPGSTLVASNEIQDVAVQSTQVISRKELQPLLNKNPKMGVTDKQIVSKFTLNGRVDFQHDSDQLKGHEPALVKKNVRVYLVVDADPEKLHDLGFDQLETELNWIASKKHSAKGHWRLQITKPSIENKDPVLDAEAHRILEDLKVQLSEIQIDFN
jgi:hypothetical protein